MLYLDREESRHIQARMRGRGGNVDRTEYAIRFNEPIKTDFYDVSAYRQGYIHRDTGYDSEVQHTESRATESISPVSHRMDAGMSVESLADENRSEIERAIASVGGSIDDTVSDEVSEIWKKMAESNQLTDTNEVEQDEAEPDEQDTDPYIGF